MDKGTIIARALALLGNRHYAEDAGTQDPAEQHFPDVLLECNAAHDWSFARCLTTLTLSEDGYYHLPVDCIDTGIRFISDQDDKRKLPDGWELFGRRILPHNYSEPIHLRYTRNLLTQGGITPDFPAFNNYVIALLAARIAPEILGGSDGLQLADSLTQKAEAYRVRAIEQDRMQDRANDQHTRATTILRRNYIN